MQPAVEPSPAGHPPQLGQPLAGWTPRARPSRAALEGRRVLVRALDAAADAEALWAATHPPLAPAGLWSYLFDGPYPDASALRAALERAQSSVDPLFFVLVPHAVGRPCGYASYLRITPDHGVLEIGNILLGAGLARTAAATEAIYLLARRVFDELGYRRLEWKCNALNAPSRRAAERLGFAFEGVFECHMVVKGHNRDTAWYSITDERWPAVRAALEAWLAPENFDADGRQRVRLDRLRTPRA